MKEAKNHLWWKDAVIYQIYPRSFKDSKGDGIGDLKGIIQKMDYLSSLGIDAIWISPFFMSPMKDFGYDVSDYRQVDPIFGTINDFKLLIKKAHQKNLKVIIDQVLSHTSDQHAWFRESRKNKTNAKASWYVWADAQKDGSPPNNWQSVFGGSSWTWASERKQYYLHNFLKEQPDLNFHHPLVQKTILAEVEFWLKLGVDGFRLDTVNFYFHDKKLRNNPPVKTISSIALDVNPYNFQSHLYDKGQKENFTFLKKLRTLLNKYRAVSIGEIGDEENGLQTLADYTQDNDKLHVAYAFVFLSGQLQAEYFKKVLNYYKNIIKDGWACWPFSNHDMTRVVSRWGDKKKISNRTYRKSLAKMTLALLTSLTGSICVYQGEELGLEESVLAYEDLVDPYGIALYPQYVGRDGCRTPMVWENKEKGGFSSARQTWLPIYPQHLPYAASEQEKDPDSILHFFRKLLLLRKTYNVLGTGSFSIIHAKQPLFVVEKNQQEKKVLLVFNFAEKKTVYKIPKKYQDKETIIKQNASLKKETISLGAFGFAFLLDS